MPSSSNLCLHALALEKGVLSKAALDKALEEAGARDRPLERHLVEANQLSRDAARELEVARGKLARGCSVCRKLTYLLPKKTEAETPCEHCGGALQPPSPPKSAVNQAAVKPATPPPAAAPKGMSVTAVGGKPATTTAASGVTKVPPQPKPPESKAHAKPAAPPPRPAPKKEEPAPALLDSEDDGPPLPPRVGGTRIERQIFENERVVIYTGRLDDAPVAVRLLRPDKATRRREVDEFHREAQSAPNAGLEVKELGADALGAPFITVAQCKDYAMKLAGLLPLEPGQEGPRSSTDTSTGIFAKLNRQRQELLKEVAASSRRRERCLGKFVLLEQLGVDATELWRGWDTSQNEVVLVRVLTAPTALDGGRIAKPLEEQLVAATRVRHPNVIPLRAYGVEGNKLYLVRERFDCKPLATGPALEVVVRDVHQAAQALAYLHGQNMPHGWLCPTNVVLRGDGSIALTDLAVAATVVAANAHQVAPTAMGWRLVRMGCASPEAHDGADAAIGDVHALGAILFRAASRWLPDQPSAPTGTVDPPSDTLAIAQRCLETDPALRYASALDLARDLERVLKNEVPVAREPRPVAAAATKPSSVVTTLSGVFKKLLGRD
jgi:serine/threonine protein kinase